MKSFASRISAALGVALLTSIALSAAPEDRLSFTFDVTVTSATGDALKVDDNLTLSFTTIAGLGLPNMANSTEEAYWFFDNTHTGSEIWSDIQFSGASGAWTMEPGDATYFSGLSASDAGLSIHTLGVQVASSSVGGVGLSWNDEIITNLTLAGEYSSIFSFPGNATTSPWNVMPMGTFSPYENPFGDGYFYTAAGGMEYEYSIAVNSVTIGPALGAVPEPSTYALIAGFGVLGAMMLRRRATWRTWLAYQTTRGA